MLLHKNSARFRLILIKKNMHTQELKDLLSRTKVKYCFKDGFPKTIFEIF